MPRLPLFACTTFALLGFAGNSLLCRMALKHSAIDPASFTLLRVAAGAATLLALVRLRSSARGGPHESPQESPRALAGNWLSATALFAYAAAFSYAYVELTTATGALLLFGAVQATMVGYGWLRGERLRGWRLLGLVLALAGVAGLLAPGLSFDLSAPPLGAAALMLLAGAAWGCYSLRGRSGGDPLQATAGNFARALAPAAALSLVMLPSAAVDLAGAGYAVASGALASGLGYAAWYAALPHLRVASAATAQLSVPVIAAAAAAAWLGEPLTLRVLLASAAVLGGIALVVLAPARKA